MKKIPTLFERTFENNRVVSITRTPVPGMEWVLEGKGVATVKMDGACCAIIDGCLYRRYDAKNGKRAPEGAIPCQPQPDPVTTHWPHWVRVTPEQKESRWFWQAYLNTAEHDILTDGTYEAVGPHFQSNPYELEQDVLIRHGSEPVEVGRTWDDIREYLRTHNVEGLVFWKDGQPQCKIKRRDFGYPWNQKTQCTKKTAR